MQTFYQPASQNKPTKSDSYTRMSWVCFVTQASYNQATRLPNRKQRSGGKIGKQTIRKKLRPNGFYVAFAMILCSLDIIFGIFGK